MKTTRFVPVVAALALCAASVQGAPVISNPAAAQRPGSELVDIDYNLTGTINPVTISLEISADGGTTWAVPVTAVTGAVGANVTPGSNLRITWDAGVDWNNQLSPQMQFRLKGSEALQEQADFALVPAGTFTMGDTLDGMTDAPPHTVNLSAFYMQKKGVTKAEWDAVRTWGLTHGYTDLAVGSARAADHPVKWVVWYDVVKWCNARSEMEGLTPCYYTDDAQTLVFKTGTNDLGNTMVKWTANGYRLPTEAEREKAARGGLSGKRFPWGDTISHSEAVFKNVGGESYQTGTTSWHPTYYAVGGELFTAPVGSFAANAYGICDMAGNVWEWCWDWYAASYYGTPESLTDPRGPSGTNRLLRGGGWNAWAKDCRVGNRYGIPPNAPSSDVGFRPVRSNLSFALVPGGTFTMGDTLDGLADAPPHAVIASTLYMQKLGVTKADWDTVRAWGLANGYTDLAVGLGKAEDHPVHTVSWYDVVKWCNARSEKDGLTPCYYTDAGQTAVYRTGNTDIANTMVKWTANGYRLPTEAEREKAARGGLAGLRFPWGNTISHANANFSNTGGESYQTGAGGPDPIWGTGAHPYTSPAGSFPANGYGIYDMAGNVWEWCWDCYGAAYYASSPSTDPTGPSGSPRVLRGGGWDDKAKVCQAATRNWDDPSYKYNYYGFRPIRTNNQAAPFPTSANTPVDTRDWVKLTVIGNGTTDPTPGEHQVQRNSQIDITAIAPTPGYLPFSNWTIGTGGSATTSSANPLTVMMDSDQTITAVFPQDTRDPDSDELTNYEELVTYGTLPDNPDTDGDSFTDGYEVRHGANPNDANDFPRAKLTIHTAVEVRLESELGQQYRIESSTDLQTWTLVEEHLAGTGGEIVRFYSIREIPKRYFRAMPEP